MAAPRTATRKRARGTAVQYDGQPSQHTPIESPRGRKVHVTSLEQPTHTACGRKFGGRGWRIALRRVSCRECILTIQLDARSPKATKKRRRTAEAAA